MYIPKFSQEEIEQVISRLTPSKSRACNNNILLSSNDKTYSGNYCGHSLKRTNLMNCRFENAVFDHTSFAGSILDNFYFAENCTFNSVYLEQSILTNLNFDKGLTIEGCNFSHSYIKNAVFDYNNIRSTYFNNCYLINCLFKNCILRSTMFDSAYIVNCSFINCNMRNLNIEFAIIDNCTLDGSTISYFQLPYIIGIFKETPKNIFLGKNNETPISISDYLDEIDDSIVYFTYLEEYFPLANLYYAKKQNDIAINCINAGIEKALLGNDIRMIDNFCKLGQFYNLLSVSDIQRILKSVDENIEKERNSPLFSILLSKSYQLKSSVAQNHSKSKLEIIINTSLNESEFGEVGKLCEEIDTIIIGLMPNKITTSYQISHNSPFEICLTCIGLTSDLIGISGFIYSLISKRLKRNRKLPNRIEEYIESSNQMYINSLNTQFDMFKTLLEKTSKSKQSEIIDDFRGKIITNATEQIEKDFALIISELNQ